VLRRLEPVSAVLASGLRVLVVPVPGRRRAVLELLQHVGSRYEDAATNGISHFLEHMIFRGVPEHPTAHLLSLAFEQHGGMLNASTAADHGALGLGFPPERLGAVLPLVARVFQAPVFSELELERGIVREEILEGLDDSGQPVDAENLLRAELFAGHPLGLPITGTPEQLARFDEPLLRAHHARHYVGAGTVLTVAGPVDPDEVVRLAERAFAALPPGERVHVVPPPPCGRRFRYQKYASSSQTALRVGFRAPAENAPDEPATALLLRVLDDGMSTRLYRRICDEQGLCYDVSAAHEPYVDAGLVELAADTAHDRAPRVLTELLRLADELRQAPPTEAELAKAKHRLRWDVEQLGDELDEAAAFFGMGELTGRRQSPQDRIDEVMAVSAEAVRAVAERIFAGKGLAAVAVGRLSRGARAELQAAIDRF
jgi:predicted Zn-dependent peptidase